MEAYGAPWLDYGGLIKRHFWNLHKTCHHFLGIQGGLSLQLRRLLIQWGIGTTVWMRGYVRFC